MVGQQQRFVNDPVRGQPEKRCIEARAKPLRQCGHPIRMLQRHMQHMMRHQTDLLGKSERFKVPPVKY